MHQFMHSYLAVKDVLKLRQHVLTLGHPSAGVHSLDEAIQIIQLQAVQGGRGMEHIGMR